MLFKKVFFCFFFLLRSGNAARDDNMQFISTGNLPVSHIHERVYSEDSGGIVHLDDLQRHSIIDLLH